MIKEGLVDIDDISVLKEAEKWADKMYPCDGQAQRYLLMGAEFGYNKANEWYYPSKGEYPKECENVLCYCKVVDVKFCRIGHTIIGGDNKIRWWSSNRSEELEVYAWKEIVLPKEVKEK